MENSQSSAPTPNSAPPSNIPCGNDKGSFKKMKLNNGNYQVWIDYVDNNVNVIRAPVEMSSLKYHC